MYNIILYAHMGWDFEQRYSHLQAINEYELP